MLVQTAPTIPLQTSQSIPASPAEIRLDTSLAELNIIREAWIQKAREAGYPEIVYDVTSRLGQEIITRPRGHVNKGWSSGKVYAITREFTEQYTLADGTHQISCYLSVYIGEPDLTREGLFDQIVLSHKMFHVASWRWNVLGQRITEKEGNFLIPGKWLDVFLSMEPSANQATLDNQLSKDEEERQHLLTEMLVGKDI
jgi:hypothetical protein